MAQYAERFPVGTGVRIVDARHLADFVKGWRWHHPLEQGQCDYASREAAVIEVGFYHGGDPLYRLSGVPGLWHEECLGPAA